MSRKGAVLNVAADEKIIEGSTLMVNVTVAGATGKVKINGKEADLVNGKANVAVSDLKLGENTVTVIYGGDDTYENASATVKVNVYPKADAGLKASSKGIKAGEDTVITIELDAKATGEVSVGGNEVDVKDGKATYTAKGLKVGNYTFEVAYSGDAYFKAISTKVSVKVDKVPANVSDDVFKPKDENANSSLNPVYSLNMPSDATGNLTVKIGNKTYTKELVNGTATVEVSDLPAGDYKAVISYTGDDKYAPFSKTENSTVKVDAKITAKNTKVLYTAKGKFTVTVYGTDAKPAAGVEVIFTIKGKQVAKVKTSSKGKASYVVKDKPGSYKVTASALGVNTTKKVTVNHLVTLKKVAVKRSAKKLVLTATLKKVNKKYLKNKKITFKFNGKKYTAKTNKKGVAKVTIKKAVLKKLRQGKKITYQATYLKDTVKQTVKIKK